MISDGKFRKNEHILKSKEYRAVYKNGLSVKQGPLVLCYLPNGLAHSRIGFSISSRNVKLASRRNRARRLFREVYRKNKPAIRKGLDLVVIAKRNLSDNMMYGDAEQALFKLIRAAGLST
jgi:ribonuclease P protein component